LGQRMTFVTEVSAIRTIWTLLESFDFHYFA
jgi:hypothetical protein